MHNSDNMQVDEAPPQYSTSTSETSPPQEKGAKDGSRLETPLNVLILGETANGKSTLIRQLAVYAGNRNPEVKVGYGSLSRCLLVYRQANVAG